MKLALSKSKSIKMIQTHACKKKTYNLKSCQEQLISISLQRLFYPNILEILISRVMIEKSLFQMEKNIVNLFS